MIDGQVTSDIEYLSAIVEADYVIAQASATLDKNGKLAEDLVEVRHLGEFTKMPRGKRQLYGCLSTAGGLGGGIADSIP